MKGETNLARSSRRPETIAERWFAWPNFRGNVRSEISYH
jgi:hypothetical protein